MTYYDDEWLCNARFDSQDDEHQAWVDAQNTKYKNHIPMDEATMYDYIASVKDDPV